MLASEVISPLQRAHRLCVQSPPPPKTTTTKMRPCGVQQREVTIRVLNFTFLRCTPRGMRKQTSLECLIFPHIALAMVAGPKTLSYLLIPSDTGGPSPRFGYATPPPPPPGLPALRAHLVTKGQ